jgi:hypothetical protein
MDWSYAAMAVQQGASGLVAIVLPIPFLALSSLQGRKIAACSPGIAAVGLFFITCIVSGLITLDSPEYLNYFPSVGLLIAAILFVPSVLALRRRWVGLLHMLTLAGALFVWFVGSMAVAHDWL